jgi:hypothetical protein
VVLLELELVPEVLVETVLGLRHELWESSQ